MCESGNIPLKASLEWRRNEIEKNIRVSSTGSEHTRNMNPKLWVPKLTAVDCRESTRSLKIWTFWVGRIKLTHEHVYRMSSELLCHPVLWMRMILFVLDTIFRNNVDHAVPWRSLSRNFLHIISPNTLLSMRMRSRLNEHTLYYWRIIQARAASHATKLNEYSRLRTLPRDFSINTETSTFPNKISTKAYFSTKMLCHI